MKTNLTTFDWKIRTKRRFCTSITNATNAVWSPYEVPASSALNAKTLTTARTVLTSSCKTRRDVMIMHFKPMKSQ